MVSHYNGQNIHLPCSKQTKIKTQYVTPVVLRHHDSIQIDKMETVDQIIQQVFSRLSVGL